MPQQQGGASSQDSGDEAQGREQAAAIAAQRAAADAAIAAVAGGRQALAAMTTASAAAARAAGTVESKREAERAALDAEDAEAAAPAPRQAADEMTRALGPQVPDPAGAIADAVEQGAVLIFADRLALPPAADGRDAEAGEAEFEAVDAADDDDPVSMLTSPYTLLALDRWAFLEQSAAEAVQRLLATATPLEPKPEAAPSGDAAAERTARTLQEAARSGVTLVTGADPELPGRVAAAFPGAVLASPSPAGLRTQAALGRPAFDLRALSEDSGPLDEAEAVVVTDAQLLSLELGVELLELLPDGAHLVLCGDPGALPATGPGRLFRDLLEIDDPEFGGRIPRVELKGRPAGP